MRAPEVSDRGRPFRLVLAVGVIATIGLLIAAYTTVIHYSGLTVACFGGSAGHSSCGTVQASPWNNVAGIPVAVLGLAGYGAILASLGVRGELGRAVGFAVAFVGFLFSLYLTYREAFSIHAYCEWCLGSAACMTLLALLLGVRFVRAAAGS